MKFVAKKFQKLTNLFTLQLYCLAKAFEAIQFAK